MPLQPKFELRTLVYNLHSGFKHKIINVKASPVGFLYRLQGFAGSVHEKFLFDSKEAMEAALKNQETDQS